MIQHRHGFSFATPIVIIGAVITVSGIPAIIENPFLGIILILVGPFFWSSSYGVQIDPINQQFREYGSIYGIKNGKWKPLTKMPYLTVIKSKSGMTTYSRSNRSTTYIEDKFEVCLLSETHRQRATVQKFDTLDAAKLYAQELAKVLNKEVVVFNPEVSEKTRSRRMYK